MTPATITLQKGPTTIPTMAPVLRPPLPLEGEFVAEVVAEDEGEPKFDGHVSGIYGRGMKDGIMMGRRGLTPFELAGRFWIQGNWTVGFGER